ncbi:hypothetical protein JHN63_02100 [Streptomyces sp. MBT65]|uniref:hypothetical protein n=1 Tax=Streptomyces sp. MBT65 TaxID=1488395 RepID=UPI00190B44DD|nr:hypothetical protein [Streptomyces sp. MBT65]MBK3572634.1 hypothetical protein [Streptomyces sp. MBT65]
MNRRQLAAAIVQRRILTLVPGSGAESTTVCVEYAYEQAGQPAHDSWSGSVEGFAQRIATALIGTAPFEEETLQAGLRDELGEALIDAGGVPDTLPVQVMAQAGVLADAVLPIVNRIAAQAAQDAINQAASLFEARHRALLDGGLTNAGEVAELLREHAAELTEEQVLRADASGGH